MTDLASFIEEEFPVGVALGASGGPVRRTEIVALGSGAESRNARWAGSRRSFDAGTGVKSLADLATVVAFFERVRGRLIGFRWRDALDDRSCLPGLDPTPLDQMLGTGDGTTATFQLAKRYGAAADAWVRAIAKPVAGSVRVAVAGVETSHVTLDATTGLVTFAAGHIPGSGAAITAGFRFHVPVRFDTDELRVDLSAFAAGEVPSIPLTEIRP